MKTIKKIIILFLMILILYGCDYTEINDLIIVSGMLIDYKDNMYEVTTEIIDNDDKSKTINYTNTCNNIDECIFKISKYSNKNIFISQLKVLLLTENTIKNNNNYYDYFLRDTKSKMNFNVYYVSDKDKEDILNIYKDNNSSLYLKDLTKYNNKLLSNSYDLKFLDLIEKELNYGIDIVYPVVSIKENNDEKIISLDGLISFNENKDKVLLDDTQSMIYNMLNNSLEKTIINLKCDNDNYSLILDNINTKYKWNNNKIEININIKSNLDSYNCKYNLDEQKTTSKLSSISNEYIKDNINDLLDIQKKNNIDFLGLNNFIYKHDKNYKKYNLNNIETTINIKTIINSIGEMKNEL